MDTIYYSIPAAYSNDEKKCINIIQTLLKTNNQNFVTKRTSILFDLLMDDGHEKAHSFLTTDPAVWKDDAIYIQMKERASLLRVVNDCAERGIALVNEFNNSITKNEEQKQYLLRLVDLHRKTYPVASKDNIQKMKLGE